MHWGGSAPMKHVVIMTVAGVGVAELLSTAVPAPAAAHTFACDGVGISTDDASPPDAPRICEIARV